jgi:hypothetical protein
MAGTTMSVTSPTQSKNNISANQIANAVTITGYQFILSLFLSDLAPLYIISTCTNRVICISYISFLYLHYIYYTVDSRSPVPTRRNYQPGSGSQHWMQSPFQNLEGLGNLSPGSCMSVSSFCFSSPGRFSPGRPAYTGTLPGTIPTPGIGSYRMSPDTPLTTALTKELVDELASPLFSPVLFSPYDTSCVSRFGNQRPRGSSGSNGNSKMSLVHDFHDVKHDHADSSPHPDIFSSLSNTGIL